MILGGAGLLVGLAAGYAVGTVHAGKATARPAQSGAMASPTTITISPVLVGGSSSQIQLRCSVPAGAIGTPRQLNTVPANVAAAVPRGEVVMVLPSSGLKLTCQQ